MSIQHWIPFFKSEIRSSGAKLAAEEKISVSGSDTLIQSFVRAMPPVKVLLRSDDIGSDTFTADCSCPMGQKSQFCKHIWAALISAEKKYPDFFSMKQV